MPPSSASALDAVTVAPTATLGEALARLDAAGTGAVALCDPGGKLVGLLTDGDIRRALMRGVSLAAECAAAATTSPTTASANLTADERLALMLDRDIDHLPIVDAEGCLLQLDLRRDLVAGGSAVRSRRRKLADLVIATTATVSQAVAQLDRAGSGALAVCDADGRLAGLLTDGDVRRAVLQGRPLDVACLDIATRKPFTVGTPPSAEDALRIMSERTINQLPVVDAAGRLVDLLLRKDLAVEAPRALSAIIMAGGFGKRLFPLTRDVPKPMLTVGDRPVLERSIQQLRRFGISDISLTTHYLPESIQRYFGDGRRFGVKIRYSYEPFPMGTAGGIRLLERPSGPFVVINGDILTGVPFDEMLEYHARHGAILTAGVRKYEVEVPFGVVECDGPRITELREKPSLAFFINAGIYLLDPAAYDFVPTGRKFDMTDLIQALLGADQPVVSFPIVEYWLDIGRPEDYERAQRDFGGK